MESESTRAVKVCKALTFKPLTGNLNRQFLICVCLLQTSSTELCAAASTFHPSHHPHPKFNRTKRVQDACMSLFCCANSGHVTKTWRLLWSTLQHAWKGSSRRQVQICRSKFVAMPCCSKFRTLSPHADCLHHEIKRWKVVSNRVDHDTPGLDMKDHLDRTCRAWAVRSWSSIISQSPVAIFEASLSHWPCRLSPVVLTGDQFMSRKRQVSSVSSVSPV